MCIRDRVVPFEETAWKTSWREQTIRNAEGMGMKEEGEALVADTEAVSYTHLLKSVHFSYDGKKEVLKDISLTIPEGRTVAFVGPSGGGKTTLALMLCRLVLDHLLVLSPQQFLQKVVLRERIMHLT